MFDTNIYLRNVSYPSNNTDEYGNLVAPTTTDTPIYAEVLSIGYKEFYEAAAAGFKPEIKFKIADCNDYSGQQKIVYNNEVYNVIRTYRTQKNFELEIVCEKGIV